MSSFDIATNEHGQIKLVSAVSLIIRAHFSYYYHKTSTAVYPVPRHFFHGKYRGHNFRLLYRRVFLTKIYNCTIHPPFPPSPLFPPLPSLSSPRAHPLLPSSFSGGPGVSHPEKFWN